MRFARNRTRKVTAVPTARCRAQLEQASSKFPVPAARKDIVQFLEQHGTFELERPRMQRPVIPVRDRPPGCQIDNRAVKPVIAVGERRSSRSSDSCRGIEPAVFTGRPAKPEQTVCGHTIVEEHSMPMAEVERITCTRLRVLSRQQQPGVCHRDIAYPAGGVASTLQPYISAGKLRKVARMGQKITCDLGIEERAARHCLCHARPILRLYPNPAPAEFLRPPSIQRAVKLHAPLLRIAPNFPPRDFYVINSSHRGYAREHLRILGAKYAISCAHVDRHPTGSHKNGAGYRKT